MSKLLQTHFGELAEALENAAAAARKLEGAYGNATAKSTGTADDGVAGKTAKPSGASTAPAKKVAAKSAAGGKSKAPVITFDDVKAKLTELMEAKGKETVKQLLSEFGAAKLGDIGEENYGEIHARAVAAMVDEEDGGGDDDDMFGE